MFKHHLPGSAVLETERLYLRIITPEVYKYIFTALPKEDIMELLVLKDAPAFEAEYEKFTKGMETFRTTFLNFLLADKHTGQTLGKIGYHTIAIPHQRGEIGYGMDVETAKRQGLMKEAMARVLQYGFEDMSLYRVEALLSPQNTASKRLVEHFGFTCEGLLRGHYNYKGVYEDSAMYGLLRPDYFTGLDKS